MSEAALAALYRAVNQRLTASGDAWETRCYADRPRTGVPRPYAVYQWQGGGERNRLKRKDAEIVLTVRAVSTLQAEAFALAGRLSELLNDMGEQDERPDGVEALNGGPDWYILTTTQEGIVRLPESVDSTDVYHEGFMLRVVMEERV